MFSKPLALLDTSDIHQLVAQKVSESRYLEFKRQPSLEGDKDKTEFRCDVAAFANANGGWLIYGVDEDEDGNANEVRPFGVASIDDLKRQLQSILTTNIDPRLPEAGIHAIPVGDSKYYLVIRVEQSWIGPHAVKVGSGYRVPIRNDVGKHDLDYSEIKSRVLLSESVGIRIENWRSERVSRAIARRFPVLMKGQSPVMMWHVVPTQSFSSNSALGMQAMLDLEAKLPLFHAHHYSRGRSIRHDGVVYHDSQDKHGHVSSYCQVFRNGALEYVNTSVFVMGDHRPFVASSAMEKGLCESIGSGVQLLKQAGIRPPYVVGASFVQVAGVEMGVGPGLRMTSRSDDGHPCSEEVVILPTVMLQEVDVLSAPHDLKPLIDSAWNAFGRRGSPSYRDDGSWDIGRIAMN